MCTLCSLERLNIVLADDKNLEQEKRTDNLTPALFERIIINYNLIDISFVKILYN